MVKYPDEIFTGREIANLPGIEYKEEDKTTIFAEDVGGLNAEVQAIETTLGVNPQGDFETVADRLDAGGGGGINNLDGGVANTDYGTITNIDGGTA